MTDLPKRNTLKTLSAGALSALSPMVATAAVSTTSANHALTAADAASSGVEFAFERIGDTTRYAVVVSNVSDKAVALKHVCPGLVKCDDQLFDINELLALGPIHVQPGESLSFPMVSVPANSQEKSVPGGAIHMELVTVSTSFQPVVGDGQVRTTRRMLLS